MAFVYFGMQFPPRNVALGSDGCLIIRVALNVGLLEKIGKFTNQPEKSNSNCSIQRTR